MNYVTVTYEFIPSTAKHQYLKQLFERVSLQQFYESLKSDIRQEDIVPRIRDASGNEYSVQWDYIIHSDVRAMFYGRTHYHGTIGIQMLQRLHEAHQTGVELDEHATYQTEKKVFMTSYSQFVDLVLKGAILHTDYAKAIANYNVWLNKPLKITEDCSASMSDSDDE